MIDAFKNVARSSLPQKEGVGGQPYLDNILALQVGHGSISMKVNKYGLGLGGNNPQNSPFFVDMNGNVIANSIDLGGQYIETGGAGADINAHATQIQGAKIVSLSITSTQIADNSISTPKLQANSVTANEIATNAVTAGKISAGAVVAGKIAANAVTATEIASNAVTADKILAGAVTASKISVTSLSAISATLGAVAVGGSGDALGTISIRNSSNTEISKLNNSGIIVRNTRGLFFEQTNAGNYWDLSVNSANQAVMSLPTTNQFFIRNFAGNVNLFTVSSGQTFSQNPLSVNGALVCKELFLNYGQNEGNIRNVDQIHGYNDLRFYCNSGGKVKIENTNLDLNEHSIDAVDTVWAYHFNSRSDKRLKQKIKPMSTSLDRVLSLKPVSYEFKKRKGEKRFGLVAQDVLKVYPELVSKADDGMLSIDYVALIPMLITSIQELRAQIMKGKNESVQPKQK